MKTLVAYFGAGGTTAKVAKALADAAKAELLQSAADAAVWVESMSK